MAQYNDLRTFGPSNSRNALLADDVMFNQRTRGPYARGNVPQSLFEDDETQDPNEGTNDILLRELRELKDLVKDVQKRQGSIEKTMKHLASKLGAEQFDLAKSSHAANVTKILAKAYIQLGRFSKINESKTEQLHMEFQDSPYGLTVAEAMTKVDVFEKAKFTYGEQKREEGDENLN
ncbi:uncharacterized protein LOC114542892 [Dendronephthya gigantea]|uniref:uncharacterized protein LOC114542892 n=1 Tax=Dendronephthya gigantea TaxID=151771 RepID=UPI00106B097D|nr:uncharacterized protein LOC114542892 [Dendronephthya gigantea]